MTFATVKPSHPDQRIIRWENFVKLVFKELYNKFGINLRGKDMRLCNFSSKVAKMASNVEGQKQVTRL